MGVKKTLQRLLRVAVKHRPGSHYGYLKSAVIACWKGMGCLKIKRLWSVFFCLFVFFYLASPDDNHL